MIITIYVEPARAPGPPPEPFQSSNPSTPLQYRDTKRFHPDHPMLLLHQSPSSAVTPCHITAIDDPFHPWAAHQPTSHHALQYPTHQHQHQFSGIPGIISTFAALISSSSSSSSYVPTYQFFSSLTVAVQAERVCCRMRDVWRGHTPSYGFAIRF